MALRLCLVPVYLPKGTDFGTVSVAELKAIEARLKGRPRQILRFQTPDEVFSSLKLNEFIGVALQA
jgi:IS30 family transposase